MSVIPASRAHEDSPAPGRRRADGAPGRRRAGAAPRGRRAPAAPSRRRPRATTSLLLVAIVAVSAFPLYWSLVASSNDDSAAAHWPPKLLPGSHLWANLQHAFTQADYGRALLNSTIIATTVTFSVVLTSTLAGFAFAKLRVPGNNGMLAFLVLTMMVPAQLGIIPLYIMMTQWLGWTGHLHAVIVPAATSAFGVFLMRQYLSEALPNELLEAGRVDGCSTTRLYWHVVLPAARPAAAVLALFTFMGAWNDFFWPLLALGQENDLHVVQMDLPVGGGERAVAVEDQRSVERALRVRAHLVERAGDHRDVQLACGVGEERGVLAVDRFRLRRAVGRTEIVGVLRQHRDLGAGRGRPLQKGPRDRQVGRAIVSRVELAHGYSHEPSLRRYPAISTNAEAARPAGVRPTSPRARPGRRGVRHGGPPGRAGRSWG